MSTELPTISLSRWESHFSGPMEAEPMDPQTATTIQRILAALRAGELTPGAGAAQLVILGIDSSSAALMVELALHPTPLD